MALGAGELTERVTVMERISSQNEIGEQIISYEVMWQYEALPVKIKFIKSLRQITEGQAWEPTRLLMTSRYAEALLKVRRVEWNGNMYDVDGVPNGDRVNRNITYNLTLVSEE